MSVVLPAPLGPSSPKNSPGATSRSMPSRATTGVGLDVVDAADAARLDGGRAGPDGHTGPREEPLEGPEGYHRRSVVGEASAPGQMASAGGATGLPGCEADRDLAGDAGVVDDQGRVGANGRALGQLGDPAEEPGRQRRTRDAGGLGVADRALDRVAGDVVGSRASSAGTGTQSRIAPPSPRSR